MSVERKETKSGATKTTSGQNDRHHTTSSKVTEVVMRESKILEMAELWFTHWEINLTSHVSRCSRDTGVETIKSEKL